MTQYTPEEIAANRAKWLEALRSGEYKQGMNALRNRESEGFSFCCLGVACDLFDSSKWENAGSYILRDEEGNDSFDTMFPPTQVRDFLGLPFQRNDRDDEGIYQNLTARVANMNDSGATFLEIADFLEQEFSK